MSEVKRIVCPVDFSESSDHVLEYAVEVAKRFGAAIDLVHVYQFPLYAMADGVLPASPDVLAQTELSKLLDERSKRFGDRGVQVKTHLKLGMAYVEIVQLAKEIGAQLIIMPTHGRSGLQRFILGSVAERVLRTSPVPVLVVPPTDK